jgi:hypothetical protein
MSADDIMICTVPSGCGNKPTMMVLARSSTVFLADENAGWTVHPRCGEGDHTAAGTAAAIRHYDKGAVIIVVQAEEPLEGGHYVAKRIGAGSWEA